MKVPGKSLCPFCHGSKTPPLIGFATERTCNSCDKEGMISNQWLADHDLLYMVEDRSLIPTPKLCIKTELLKYLETITSTEEITGLDGLFDHLRNVSKDCLLEVRLQQPSNGAYIPKMNALLHGGMYVEIPK